MRYSKRYITFTLIVVILLFIKLNTWSEDYSEVVAFRGAQLEDGVFYPLIAKSVNEDAMITFQMDGNEVSFDKDQLYVNDQMQVMASTEFVSKYLACSVHVYSNKKYEVQRGNTIYHLTLNEKAAQKGSENMELSSAPIQENDIYYLPLSDLCSMFGYDYIWDPLNYKVSIASENAKEAMLPSSYDLRNKNRVSSIRDQGTENTCWAYAAIGSIESSLLPETNRSFSPAKLVKDRAYTYVDKTGGDYSLALANFLSWKGPVTEKSSKVTEHVQEVHFYNGDDIDDIKWAVFQNGGVSTSIYASLSNAMMHSSSYYNAKTNAYCYTGSMEPNHDVIIVGWNDDYSATNFNGMVHGKGAFICQNSWGSDFGDDGVFYVSYYDTNIGDQSVSYAKIQPKDNYDTIYQSDLSGWTGQIGYSKENVMAANIYTAKEDEMLQAAGFYTLGKNTTYELYLVSDYTDVNSLANRKLVSSGVIKDAGYYTIPLEQEALLTKGTKFAVIVSLTTPGLRRPMAIEYQSARMAEAVDLTDGEGYISKNGLEWDSVEQMSQGNLCLKAYGNRYTIEE